MSRCLSITCLALMAMAVFGAGPAGQLRLAGFPEDPFEAAFESLVWRVDGSIEIRGTTADGQVVAIQIQGIDLEGMPLKRITAFSGETQASPQGPTSLVFFKDGSGRQVGILATGFRARYAVVGTYHLAAGKILAVGSPEVVGMAVGSINLVPEIGAVKSLLPGRTVDLGIAGQAWGFTLVSGLIAASPSKNRPQDGPTFSADFFAFVKP